MDTITYRVRPGFVFTDNANPPRRHAPGDTVQLDAAVGDGAHQLERVDAEAAAKAAAAADAAAAEAAAKAAEAEQAAKDAEAAAAEEAAKAAAAEAAAKAADAAAQNQNA